MLCFLDLSTGFHWPTYQFSWLSSPAHRTQPSCYWLSPIYDIHLKRMVISVSLLERILEQKKKGNLSQRLSTLSIRIVNWSSESVFSYSSGGSSTDLSLKAIFGLRGCSLESTASGAELVYSGFWMTGSLSEFPVDLTTGTAVKELKAR